MLISKTYFLAERQGKKNSIIVHLNWEKPQNFVLDSRQATHQTLKRPEEGPGSLILNLFHWKLSMLNDG